jgi:hypothetical protein
MALLAQMEVVLSSWKAMAMFMVLVDSKCHRSLDENGILTV